ncbi:hypothetical protein [Streptomyces endophyticus]|uniref:Uncharacterized protein n=1 Tax=Streptomyces endophyticus TaxID=714166 RepID=A0ABU6F7V2_9ACTN|nr:hypothetical protein [Streptomyces endophyticus]MEB8340064.1 hypothetical protein [Streptomyces endophyticus]
MEQRMENEKVTPVTGAGFDPAHIPGLTPPVRESESEEATEAAEPAEEVTPEPEAEEPTREEPPEASPGKEPEADGPAMEAEDRRGSITVDATGVRFTLDDQEADFTWDEISAVEYGTVRKRLTVTVHMPNSRWFPNDVEAPDKARLAEWTDQLDKALDTYFEE